MRKFLTVYCKGFAMGSADVVPGVSGATIALIVGIYDRLIRAITAIDPRAFRPAMRVHEPTGRTALRTELERIDAAFLVALGLGIGTAIVAFSELMHTAVTEYPVPTYGFFSGLIGASAIVLYGEIEQWTRRRVVVSAAGVVVAAGVTGLTQTTASHGPAMIVLAGGVAICAMLLPGVSGAFFLLILGQYEYMTGVPSAFIDALIGVFDGNGLAPVVETGTVIALFGLGVFVGLFTMAHAVRRALAAYRAATLAFLVSLMVGALRLPVTEVMTNLGMGPLERPLVAVAAAVVGAGAVLLVDHTTAGLEYEPSDA
ncbi:DUF368 domain-containing protein [Natrinema ejinorense]|uniref:DUF368 domain-containing protein n=1 Tax=Natrinema ejinorense TaxID=373386 RepID=A0A2A5QXP0_9EURY|nr:DUF368 domain-containing protein [Natrinema ejinorense]PCR91553.1 DUF368 domain-containing protein [Natrinema ejinorense]